MHKYSIQTDKPTNRNSITWKGSVATDAGNHWAESCQRQVLGQPRHWLSFWHLASVGVLQSSPKPHLGTLRSVPLGLGLGKQAPFQSSLLGCGQGRPGWMAPSRWGQGVSWGRPTPTGPLLSERNGNWLGVGARAWLDRAALPVEPWVSLHSRASFGWAAGAAAVDASSDIGSAAWSSLWPLWIYLIRSGCNDKYNGLGAVKRLPQDHNMWSSFPKCMVICNWQTNTWQSAKDIAWNRSVWQQQKYTTNRYGSQCF